MMPSLLLLFVLGMLDAAMAYVACVLLCSGVRLYRVERDWRLLEERIAVERLERAPARLTAPSDGLGG